VSALATKTIERGDNEMSNVIDFLEQAGRDAAMRHASREQLLHAMRAENIEPALQKAVLRPHAAALAALLGAREVMFSPNTKAPKPAAKKSAKKAPAKKAPAKRK
jgi:hypothetical protein